MKEGLSYIELIALVRELKELIGSRVENVYHPQRDELILHLYKGKKKILKINIPRFLCITEYKIENPKIPSHFCMFLRKYLNNARLIDITQPNFERIVEFEFKKGEDTFFLICELFSKGNLIICDKEKRILVPLKSQSWKDRIIRPKEEYKLPPRRFDLGDLDFTLFKKLIMESGKDQIVKSLATSLGIGGIYAEELCFLSNIEKSKNPKELEEGELRILFNNFYSLIEKAKEGEIRANVIIVDETQIDVQPFLLEIYAVHKKKMFESYNKALDYFFIGHETQKLTNQAETKIEKEIIKQEAILQQHKNYLDELKEKSQIYKKQADYIYQHLGEIQDIFQALHYAREKNKGWDEIISVLESKKAQGNIEAKMIREIIPEEGVIVLDFDSGIKLNFRIDVTENANQLYEKAKKMESKIDGVVRIIKEVEEKINNLKKAKAETEKLELHMPKKIEKREKEWYEKFHWFFTSEGKLVIGGRNATQNEILIKKYIEQDDIVFHADVHGSPFAIMKKGKESTDEEKREAAIFTLCYSKAWQNKRIESVYWIHPHQLSKKAPSGEYIARGAFMIYGRKKYVKEVELKYAIGIQLEPFRIISGPVENVRRKAKYYAVILPDGLNKDELSKEIKHYFLSVCREMDKELIEKIKIEEIKEHTIQNSKIFGVIK